MMLSPTELRDLSDRFFNSFNSRDFAAAGDLYARDAVYESPAVAGDGRLTGRENIIAYFTSALEEDPNFRLSIVEQFVGANMVVTLSSEGSATFVDILRVSSDGRIVEHLEVTPQPTQTG